MTSLWMVGNSLRATSDAKTVFPIPPDPAKVNVAIDCAVVGQTDGSGNQQWHIDTTSLPARLVLDGALCQRAQQSGLGRGDVLLGCPSVN